jgi:predicted DNA-binding transcriptional regulator AlpA
MERGGSPAAGACVGLLERLRRIEQLLHNLQPSEGRFRITKPKGPIRLVEVAELLGVSKQRAHQIADDPGFPSPLAEDARGRVWSRDEVQAWAKRWRREKPWRRT